MDEHQYALGHTADASERERLGLMEQLQDAWSQRYLTALGIQKGWRCLEVGAGHGSVARWLAEQIGPQGRVVATDINPRFLTEMQLPNVEVRQHDIRADPLEADTYDLAHCRFVLAHMPDPQRVVRRMVEAVRLGGWLLIEEVDYSSRRAVEASHPRAETFNRQNREIPERIAQAKLFDPYLGRRVRGLLEDAGLTEIENEGVRRIVRGGEAEARLNCATLQAFMEQGILSPTEYAALQAAFFDPSFSFIARTTGAAWGKRAN
jgi:ubiquinone/menaquinone biosynthesis C-methylase UbiE